ncbi:MAG: PrsW family intramembrane metalloprotease [Verrucomicrobia bacterium]|nr:PrsW family intramembrane metalloprotease [Verrucomicrobiota bacterium]
MPIKGTWQILGLVLASAVFWMQYVDLKDRAHPEPRKRLLSAFLLGIVAGTLAFLFFTATERMGLPDVETGSRAWKAWFCFMLIGPVEEGAKILVASLVIFRWTEYDELIDGFVYAAAVSLGFASLENFYHLPGLPLWEQLARTATLPLTHTLFGAVWGFGMAHARLCVPRGTRRVLWVTGCILLAMSLHGLYDFLLFAYQATVLTSALVLLIWSFVIYRARALARRGGACRVPKPRAAAHENLP